MISRISDNTKFDTITGNLSPLQKKAESVLQQLTTQKKINQPSDDPEGMKTVLGLRSAGASAEQYRDNIVHVNSWLKITASNFQGVRDFLLQVQGAVQNLESASFAERVAAAGSLEDLSNQILSLANDQVAGRYIFSGSMTDTKPFPDATSGYMGDDLSLQINVGQNSALGYNITGDAVFTFTNGMGVVDDIFKNFENLITVLRNPASTDQDVSDAMASLRGATEQVQDRVEGNLMKVDAILANLEYADNHLADLHNRVTTMLSEREDADISQLAVEFQMRLLAINASYSVATKIEESSLLNFLK